MKKYFSAGMLYARKSVYKLIAVILFSIVGEAAVYMIDGNSQYFLIMHGKYVTGILFILSFVLLTVLLVLDSFRDKGNAAYTLQRLQISEFAAFLCQCAVYVICYMVLYGRWLIIISALCLVFIKTASVTPAVWKIYDYFFNEEIMHNILPVGDVSGFVRNLSAMIALGISVAAGEVLRRYDKWTLGPVVVLAVMVIAGSRWHIMAETVIMIAVIIWIIFIAIVRVRTVAHNGRER